MQTKTIIFDLSEVLISGIVGIEKPLAALLQVDQDAILPAFVGQHLVDLCCGRLTETAYLDQVIQARGWEIAPADLQKILRANFHRRIPGMESCLSHLTQDFELILLSDHAREWVDYIHSIHPFLSLFKAQFFSYQFQQTKQEPSTFQKVLSHLKRQPGECLFVDDSQDNIQTAARVGIPGILFTTTEDFLQQLSEQIKN